MVSSRSCNNCGKTSLVRNDVSGDLICSLCGVVQEYDQFEAHISGINGHKEHLSALELLVQVLIYSYKERKFFQAQSLIDELTSRLGVSSKVSDSKAMISSIREVEFGQGDWFQVLLDEHGHNTDALNRLSDSHCFISQNNILSTRPSDKHGNKLLHSPECLSMLYKKSSGRVDLQDCGEWWNGKSELSRNLLLRQLLKKDVGFEAMPPSFISSCLKCDMRREKINAARLRIDIVMHPWNSDLVADDCSEKKLKGRKVY